MCRFLSKNESDENNMGQLTKSRAADLEINKSYLTPNIMDYDRITYIICHWSSSEDSKDSTSTSEDS